VPVDAAIRKNAKAIWVQEAVVHEAAAGAGAAGLVGCRETQEALSLADDPDCRRGQRPRLQQSVTRDFMSFATETS